MGSLMAGWDSPTSDPKSVKYKRNKSLMKEEIDNYWREHKSKDQEDHLKPISSSSDISHDDDDQESKSKEDEKQSGVTKKETKNLEKFMKTNAWWTRSNLAFLNEPPVFEGNTKRYASQFHVANLSTSL